MVKHFKEILKDIYIFPTDTVPQSVPILKEMMNKFIIKCGGKRAFSNFNIPLKNVIPYKTSKSNFDPSKKLILISEDYTIFNESNNEILQKSLEMEAKVELFRSRKKTVLSSKAYKTLKKVENVSKIVEKIGEILEENDESDEEDEGSLMPSTEDLEKIRGLHGVKFKLSKISSQFHPWEIASLKSSYFKEKFKDSSKRLQLQQISNRLLFKAYPESYNSSNYDIIKCWACGVQIAAINIQATEDIFSLYDMIFFRQYKNCGFVLKPKRLLEETFEFNSYSRPNFGVILKVVSLFSIGALVKAEEESVRKEGKFKVKIKCLGSKEDESNPSFSLKLSGGIIFPVILDNKEANFLVYEADLGGFVFLLYSDDKVIGRGVVPFCMMKEGYRRVPLFDNKCNEIENSYLIVHLKKYAVNLVG